MKYETKYILISIISYIQCFVFSDSQAEMEMEGVKASVTLMQLIMNSGFEVLM